MREQLKRFAIPGLRWTLGVVVLWQSIQFVLSHSQGQHLTKLGLPMWVQPALGGTEILAVLLFLLPATSLVGGYSLLAIFAIAILIHCLHDEFDVGGLLVYAMAVVVCITDGKKEAADA
jgi:hypothetical protein